MDTIRINTWPAVMRHDPALTFEFYRTMGVDVAESQRNSMRSTYRYARRHGLPVNMARITVVHAFEAGVRSVRDLDES